VLRPIQDSDTTVIDEWIARDAEHSAKDMTAAFFRQADTISLAIDDDKGPIMYVRIDPLDAETVRLHIQFDSTQQRRTAVALAHEFPTVRALLFMGKVKRIIFESVSERLIQFCEKRFGFTRVVDSNDYVLDPLLDLSLDGF
jgi:hypothetical protein